MRSLRGVMFAVGAAAGVSGLFTFLAVGCGGINSDDVDVDIDAGDASRDGNLPRIDANQILEDSGVRDTGPVTDGSGDVVDAAPQVPPGLLPYINDHLTAWCTKFLGCCPGGVANYNVDKCKNETLGWLRALEGYTSFDGGRVDFDVAAGAACIAAINALPCGTQTAADWSRITDACYNVTKGRRTAGDRCKASAECLPNLFCDSTVDGGACTPVVGQGQRCNTKAPRDEMCAGRSKPTLFCDVVNNLDDAGTCQPLLANGASCVRNSPYFFTDIGCQAGLCGDNSLCGGSASYPYTGFCNANRR